MKVWILLEYPDPVGHEDEGVFHGVFESLEAVERFMARKRGWSTRVLRNEWRHRSRGPREAIELEVQP